MNDLTTVTPEPLPALPARFEAKIRIQWNGDFDRPVAATHSLSLDERREAWRVVKAQLEPCGNRFAAAQVAPLFSTLKAAKQDSVDINVLAKTVTEELAKLPADLVGKACNDHLVSSKFKPTPADLIDLMEPELSKRRAILRALEKPSQEPERKPVDRATPEHIDAVLKRAGYTPRKPARTA